MIDIAAIKAGRVRVTVLSGFLGAGKTTLLNHIIQASRDSKVAVIVNDFGDINIDSELIEGREDCQLSLTGGCICCSIQKDLLDAVIAQMKQKEKPEHIIVECSGVSDPSRVLNTLAFPLLRFHLRVDGLFTVIDCSQLLRLDAAYLELARRQIEPANLLILNKIDLVDEETLEEVRHFIRGVSPEAVILETTGCKVPLDLILGWKELPELEDLGQLEEMDVHVHRARDGKDLPAAPPHRHGEHDHRHGEQDHRHDEHDLTFESWSFDCEQMLTKTRIRHLMENLDPDIIRVKGFVHWDDPKHPLVLVNRVGQWVDFETYFQEENVPRKTRLVFIGKPGWKRNSDIESRLLSCRSE